MTYNKNQYAGYKPYKGTTKAYAGSRPYKSTPQLSENAQQYSPQYNQQLQQNVFQAEQKAGINVKQKRSILDRFFDSLNIGQYPVMNALYNLTDDDPETTALKGAWEGLKSANPFGKDYKDGERYFSDVLGNAGWNPEDKAGKAAKFAVGLAGDIFLDPTTYVGNVYGVGSKIVKGTGTKVGKVTIKKLGEEVAEKSIKTFATKGSDEIVQSAISIIKSAGENSKVVTFVTNELLERGTKEAVDVVLSEITTKGYSQIADEITKQLAERGAGRIKQMATPEAIQALMRRTDKMAGIYDIGENGIGIGFRNMPFADKLGVKNIHKDLVSEKTLRELGDKTIAPYYQKLRHGIGDGFIGKTFDSLSEDGTKLLARTNIEEASKVVLFTDYQKKLTGELAEKNKQVAQFVKTMSADLTMEDRRKITKYLETSDMFKKRIANTEVGIAKVKELQDIRESLRTEIYELTKKGNLLGDEKKRYEGLKSIYDKINEIKILNTPIHKYMGVEQVDLDIVNKFMHSSVDDIANELRKNPNKYKDIINLTDDNVMEQAYTIRALADGKLSSYPPELQPFVRGEQVVDNIGFKEVKNRAKKVKDEVKQIIDEITMTSEEVTPKVSSQISKAVEKISDNDLSKFINPDGTIDSDGVMKKLISEVEKSTGKKFMPSAQDLIDDGVATAETVQQKLKRLASKKELQEFDANFKATGQFESLEGGKYLDRQTGEIVDSITTEASKFVDEHVETAQDFYKKALEQTPQRKGQSVEKWMEEVKSTEKRLRNESGGFKRDTIFQSVSKKVVDMPPNLYQAKKLGHKDKVKLVNDIIKSDEMLGVKADFVVNRADARNINEFLTAFYNSDLKGMTDVAHRLHPNYEYARVVLKREFGDYSKLSKKMKDQRNTRLNELLYNYNEEGIKRYTERFTEEVKLKGKGELADGKRLNNLADVEAKRFLDNNPPPEYAGSMYEANKNFTPTEMLRLREEASQSLNKGKSYNSLTQKGKDWVDSQVTKAYYDKLKELADENILPSDKIELARDYLLRRTDTGIELQAKYKDIFKAGDKIFGDGDNYKYKQIIDELSITSDVTDKIIKNADDLMVSQDKIAQRNFGKSFDQLDAKQKLSINEAIRKKMEENIKAIQINTDDGLKSFKRVVDGETIVDAFDYKGIKIMKPIADMNTDHLGRLTELTRWIDRLPENVRHFIADKGIEIRLENYKLSDIDALSDTKNGLMHLFHSKGKNAKLMKEYQYFTLPHEVAHFIGKELSKSTSAPKGWKKIRTLDGVEWISEYAKKAGNEAEDFAESVARYMTNPQRFITEYPERAKVIQDTLNNIKVDEGKVKAMQLAVEQHKQMPKKAVDELRSKLFNDKKNYEAIINDFNSNKIDIETAKRKLQETTDLLTKKDEFENYMKLTMSTKDYHDTLDLAPVLFDSLDESENVKGVMKFMYKEFERMGLKEQEVGLLKKMIDDYVPRILNPDLIPEKSIKDIILGGSGKKFNPHDLMRKLEGTIEQINATMEQKQKIKKFFLDDIMDIYTARAVKHNELIYDKKYYDRLLGTFGNKINKTNFSLASDVEAVIPVAHVKRFLEMNDKLYDKKTFLKNLGYGEDFLDKTKTGLMKINKDKVEALARMKETGFDMFALPQVMYNKANHIGKIQLGNDTQALLGLYDKALHLWKINVTAVNPGFHVRNFFSNNFQNYLDLGGEAFDSKTQQEALELLKSGAIDATGTITTRKGKHIRYDDIRKWAVDTGVLDEGFFGADLPNVGKKMYNKSSDEVATLLQKINPTDAKNFVPYEMGRNVGNRVENHARLVNFIAHLKRGLTPEEASEQTLKYLFDYGDLTDFEKQVMKRIIPFYTWARKNIPLQLEQMVEKSHRYTPIAKSLRAVEQITPEGQRVDKSFVNDFALDWIQLPNSVKNLDGRDEPLFFSPNLPYGDIDKIPNPFKPKDALRNIASQSSPLLKVPIEIATNKNMFFDSPINRGEGHKKPLPGYMQPSNFIRKQMGHDVDLKTAPPEIRYALDQISSVSNIGEAIEKVGFDRAVHLLNWLGGVKVASYDYEKYKTHALRDRLGNVTKKAGYQR